MNQKKTSGNFFMPWRFVAETEIYFTCHLQVVTVNHKTLQLALLVKMPRPFQVEVGLVALGGMKVAK